MKNKGITLIALVITIIILLILAGAAVSIGLNENGIFEKANEAKKGWNNDTLKEEVSFALNLYWNEPSLREKLEKITGAEIEIANEISDICYVTKNNTEITVYADGDIIDGKVEVWDGQEVSSPKFEKVNDVWFWYISKPSQLKFLADFVNNGKALTAEMQQMVIDAGYTDTSIVTLTNYTEVHLTNNLDMGAREAEGTTLQEKWETDANKNVQWTPIGSEINNTAMSKAFSGLFEGNNFFIKGIYINESQSETGNAGLFGGLGSAVWDLTIKNSYIKGRNFVGGIAVCNSGSFKNCNIIDSTVISTENTAGGIVMASWRKVINCNNINTFVSGHDKVGGIIAQKNSVENSVENCSNSGMISGNYMVGGIVGHCLTNTTITGCTNTGNIKTKTTAGSCFGGIVGNGLCQLTDCHNSGYISGYNCTGGLVRSIR